MKVLLALCAALLLMGCSALCEDPCKKGERTLEASGPRVEEKGLVEEAEGVLGDVGQAIEDAFDAALHFNFNRDVLGCDIPECHCKRKEK
jgi:hypothetical protein